MVGNCDRGDERFRAFVHRDGRLHDLTALLPANAAYRMIAERPSVILLQTTLGDDTIERWAEICLS